MSDYRVDAVLWSAALVVWLLVGVLMWLAG